MWLPIAVTLWVITYIVSASDQLINLLPEHWQPMHLIGFNIPGLGVIVAVLVLFVTGLFGANVLGRRIIAAWDALLGRIPVVKSIYSSVKKVSESLLSDSRQSFKTPALVPFPQPDIWTLAFVSGNIPDNIRQSLARRRRIPQRVCAHHAQSHRWRSHYGEEKRCAHTRHERGRCAQICDFAGHGAVQNAQTFAAKPV